MLSVFTLRDTGEPTRPLDLPGHPAIPGEGHLYVVEFDGAAGVTVGVATGPLSWVSTVRSQGEHLGRRPVRGAVTGPHVEAESNEQALLARCREAAGLPPAHEGALFPLTRWQVMKVLMDLPQTRATPQARETDLSAEVAMLREFLGGEEPGDAATTAGIPRTAADAEPNRTPLATAEAVAHAIVAAIHDIARQSLHGHDQQTVRERLTTDLTMAHATLSYEKARRNGKTPKGAVRDAALDLVKRYRVEHRLL